MKRGFIFIGSFLIVFSSLHSQEEVKTKKKVFSVKNYAEIVLDGVLNEEVWSKAVPATNFTQLSPNPGIAPSQKTEVKVIFDDEAIYIGARMWDNAPDSILTQFTSRDGVGNSDEFGVVISTYDDGLNGFTFSTTPSGVLIDYINTPNGFSYDWSPVWDVKTVRDDKGWVAELKIPWSALRFKKMSEEEKPVWGVNFWRGIRRHREVSYWAEKDPTRAGKDLSQNGELHGLTGITPPRRLTLFPYVSAYVGNDEEGGIGTNLNGGVDLKAGIGDAFTLDMTLIPDFGQVVADNLVLNLSPYEIRFAENRPFFTEGTELFNRSGLFYSRRVGENQQLINATKFSGRTDGGLGIGALQAFSSDEYLTSYTVAVLDQNIRNNGFIHGISTLVMREGAGYDALVQGVQFQLKNPENSYSISGRGSYNSVISETGIEDNLGHSWGITVSKLSGNFTFFGNHSVKSKFYNPNDLGFLRAPNKVNNTLAISYKIVEPFGRFTRFYSKASISYSRLYDPNTFTSLSAGVNVSASTRNFNFFMFSFDVSPVNAVDYFEPRIDGMFWNNPRWGNVNLVASTDYRKRFAFDFRMSRAISFNDSVKWNGVDINISPRFRFSDKLSINYFYNFNPTWYQQGFATLTSSGSGTIEDDVSIFGERHNKTNSQVINVTYIITNRASINARIRHYWSEVEYVNFFELGYDGNLHPTTLISLDDDGTSDLDVNYNAWSVDLGLKWYFSPGSELSVVWKNTLQSRGDLLPTNYFDNWELMLEEKFVNSLSVKALYYLDFKRQSKR
ncbi:MAG: hypothetical protein COA49_06205 [Bacteroidetes bacterium]|nr:MAG: hypothetical protein COA49_06205 [Bacteroidota bacterium]